VFLKSNSVGIQKQNCFHSIYLIESINTTYSSSVVVNDLEKYVFGGTHCSVVRNIGTKVKELYIGTTCSREEGRVAGCAQEMRKDHKGD
jgi:hypothetical protein